jgi:hypothetical protein
VPMPKAIDEQMTVAAAARISRNGPAAPGNIGCFGVFISGCLEEFQSVEIVWGEDDTSNLKSSQEQLRQNSRANHVVSRTGPRWPKCGSRPARSPRIPPESDAHAGPGSGTMHVAPAWPKGGLRARNGSV